jgi:hypothetical protein
MSMRITLMSAASARIVAATVLTAAAVIARPAALSEQFRARQRQ